MVRTVDGFEIHLSVLTVGELRRGIDRIRAKDPTFSAEQSGSSLDVLMAATAIAHELVLVTRNVGDVAWTGVACINPFDAG